MHSRKQVSQEMKFLLCCQHQRCQNKKKASLKTGNSNTTIEAALLPTLLHRQAAGALLTFAQLSAGSGAPTGDGSGGSPRCSHKTRTFVGILNFLRLLRGYSHCWVFFSSLVVKHPKEVPPEEDSQSPEAAHLRSIMRSPLLSHVYFHLLVLSLSRLLSLHHKTKLAIFLLNYT